jgi:hypothetical protein
MSEVTWGDDSIRIRLFQTATRVSAHFYDAVAGAAGSGAGLSSKHLEDLNKRWLLLEGDQTVIEYERSLEKQLLPLAGDPVFDHIRAELAKTFVYDQRLWDLNKKALEEVRKCIASWGGPKAKKRIKQLKILPLHFESTDQEQMQFFFERDAKRILCRAGAQELLLRECMILEFSFFHEYLSHTFPTWAKDVEPVSEGLLFALEFDWFESEYTVLDNDLLLKVWQHRLGPERDAFWAGRWLLKRCDSRDCVRKFLLEWVARWDDFDEDDNLDLVSQLKGVYAKTGYKLGGKLSEKQLKTQELLDAALCGRCDQGTWDIRTMRKELASALGAYEPSK